jgi:hypothetical protein
MFLVPSVLGLQFHNCWRYICFLLGRWFLLVRGLLVLFDWLGFMLWGPGGVVWPLHSFSLSSACFFLLFDSALQGWGPTVVVGAFLFLCFLDYYCFLGCFTVFIPCTQELTYNFVIFPLYQGRYLLFHEILLVLQCWHERK